MRTSTWWIIIIVLLLIILGLAWMLFVTPAPSPTTVNATSTVATTTNTTGSTTTATTTAQTPVVIAPTPGATVTKTFSVQGQAPGNWFFEAVFPVQVQDGNGNVVATAQAHAQGDWMTSGMVPFTATVSVAQYSGPATLVLKKDNPSGLPQNDGSFSVPITVQ